MSLPRPKLQTRHMCCGHGPMINDADGHWWVCDANLGGCGEILRGVRDVVAIKHQKTCPNWLAQNVEHKEPESLDYVTVYRQSDFMSAVARGEVYGVKMDTSKKRGGAISYIKANYGKA